MSSNGAEAPGRERRRTRRPVGVSITLLLSLMYGLSAFVLLAVVTALLYWAVTENLELDDSYFLNTKIRSLRTIVAEHEEDSVLWANELSHEVQKEGGHFEPDQHYIFFSRILDEAGRVLIETPDMARVIPAAYFPAPVGAAEFPKELAGWRSVEDRSYWLMAAMGKTVDGKPVVIQVALDDTAEATLLTRYRYYSVAVLIVGTLSFGILGVFIARRALRPLRDIATTADRITASHLDERIAHQRWPRELSALAETLDRMFARLEGSITRLRQFSGDMAHELRTPIQNLMSATEVALSKPRQPEEYRQILESNLEEFGRQSRMINNLLFLARAEDPHTQIQRARFDARREIEAIKEYSSALAEERGVTVTCRGQAELDADPVLFRHAMINLLSNALRYTPKGGQILLSVEGAGDDAVVVQVSDTGCGIAPQHLPRIFDRWYRPDRAGAQPAEGGGLGLAIVKSIMELHGGSAAVESDLGRGATFVLRFPATKRVAPSHD